MKRSIRRHQKKVARVHLFNIVAANRYPWWKHSWMFNGEVVLRDPPKLWRPPNKLMMLTPMSHHRETLSRPARVKSRRFAHLIVRGRDPDTLHWPDLKKPYDGYW